MLGPQDGPPKLVAIPREHGDAVPSEPPAPAPPAAGAFDGIRGLSTPQAPARVGGDIAVAYLAKHVAAE